MKVLILIVIGSLVVGCGEDPAIKAEETTKNVSKPEIVTTPSDTKEPPANVGKELKPEDVVGSYEAGLGEITFRFVLLESGVVENYFNGIKEPEDAKWKIQGAEVHIEKGKSDGTVIVNKIESNGDFTVFARIRNGKREDFQNRTYKKIKSEKETPSKGDDKNSTTAKPVKELTLEEKVVGTYERKTGGITFRIVLLENGVCEAYRNGKKRTAKWSISENGEFHIEIGDGSIEVSRINKDSSLTHIAYILNGKRKDLPKDKQETAKKIK